MIVPDSVEEIVNPVVCWLIHWLLSFIVRIWKLLEVIWDYELLNLSITISFAWSLNLAELNSLFITIVIEDWVTVVANPVIAVQYIETVIKLSTKYCLKETYEGHVIYIIILWGIVIVILKVNVTLLTVPVVLTTLETEANIKEGVVLVVNSISEILLLPTVRIKELRYLAESAFRILHTVNLIRVIPFNATVVV